MIETITIQEKQSVYEVRSNASAIAIVCLLQEAFSFLFSFQFYAMVSFGWAVLFDFFGEKGPYAHTVFIEISDVVFYIIVLLIPFLFAAKVFKLSVKDIIGTGKPSARVYIMMIFLGLGLSSIASFLNVLLEMILNFFGYTMLSVADAMSANMPLLLIQYISIAMIPPLVEEICYRGVLFCKARSAMSSAAAIWISTILFAGMHMNASTIILAVLFGLLAGYSRERYQSIKPAIAGHWAVNTIYFLYYALYAVYPEAQAEQVFLLLEAGTLILGAIGIYMLGASGKWETGKLWSDFAYKMKRFSYVGILMAVPMIVLFVWFGLGVLFSIGVF